MNLLTIFQVDQIHIKRGDTFRPNYSSVIMTPFHYRSQDSGRPYPVTAKPNWFFTPVPINKIRSHFLRIRRSQRKDIPHLNRLLYLKILFVPFKYFLIKPFPYPWLNINRVLTEFGFYLKFMGVLIRKHSTGRLSHKYIQPDLLKNLQISLFIPLIPNHQILLAGMQ